MILFEPPHKMVASIVIVTQALAYKRVLDIHVQVRLLPPYHATGNYLVPCGELYECRVSHFRNPPHAPKRANGALGDMWWVSKMLTRPALKRAWRAPREHFRSQHGVEGALAPEDTMLASKMRNAAFVQLPTRYQVVSSSMVRVARTGQESYELLAQMRH